MNRTRTPSFLLASTILTSTLAFLSSSAPAQSVPVEKYSLPNGMTVILHEDHALPIVTINTWYRVGAQDEPPGRSGFAHLFEHLMFMGTKRVPGSDFDNLMERGGGANNASTDLHRTNYYSWGPSSLLPTLLWLDADRLEDMGLNMNQEKLDKQRDVVRNELRQNVENRPYGKAEEAMWHLMYPPTHPYYTGVIGTHEDLEAANVVNVKDFFANFYLPSNASLVIAGDFKSAEIKPLVEKLFGSLPPGQPVSRKYSKPTDKDASIPITLDKVKRFTAIDKVQLPKISFVYHSPRAFSPGDAEMRLASDILADGKASRLYKRLVIDEKLAAEVDAAQQSFPLTSIFNVDVTAKPDADLDRIEKIMDEEIARLIKDGPTTEELDRYKASIELGVLSGLQSLQRKADALNEYEYYLGEPNSFKRDLDRYRSATADGIKAWAAKTLTPNARAIIRVLPEEPTRTASGRDTRPQDLQPGAFSPPAPQTFTLSNGLKVLLWPRTDLPLVSILLTTNPTGSLDPKDKPGAASLAAEMLTEGAGDLDSLAFENAVQSLGGAFNAGASEEDFDISMTILKRNLGKGLSLFSDAIQHPRFETKDWQRVQSLRIDDLKQADDQPAAVASKVAARLLFGDSNPYATPSAGTIPSVEKLTLDDVKSISTQLLDPARCTLLIAGDLSPDEAKSVLDKALGAWKSSASAAPAPHGDFTTPTPMPKRMRLVIVDRPGATQTYVRFIAPGTKRNNPDRVKLDAIDTILGGSFTSRLNQNLREEHGYTYGARCQFAMDPSTGSFSAGAGVQTQVTGPAIQEFFNEFNRIKTGDISDAEVTKARETVRNETVRAFGTLGGILGAASSVLSCGLPYDSIATDLAALEKISANDLNSLARTAFRLDEGLLVLVGDKSAILPQLALLKDLNLPTPEYYDTNGDPVKDSSAQAPPPPPR